MKTESVSETSNGLDKVTPCRPRGFHFIGVTESNIWIYYSNCTQNCTAVPEHYFNSRGYRTHCQEYGENSVVSNSRNTFSETQLV